MEWRSSIGSRFGTCGTCQLYQHFILVFFLYISVNEVSIEVQHFWGLADMSSNMAQLSHKSIHNLFNALFKATLQFQSIAGIEFSNGL